MRSLALILIVWCASTLSALAQSAVPEFRFIGSRDMDFYGSDLDALFETDLDACVRACAVQDRCVAFTYNTRSRACFPKSAVNETQPYVGAISARKSATEASVLDNARSRTEDLSFLQPEDLSVATTQARDLGLRHPAAGLDLASVLEAARARANTGDPVQAAGWMGAAVSLSDRADLWAEYARLLLAIDTRDGAVRAQYVTQAVSAAVNGYLRGATPAARAAALEILARALEAGGRGRDAIPVLRLAIAQMDRTDLAAALDALIAKYGFRVTDSVVESDTAAPRLCAQFSEQLVPAGVDYEPFVRLPDPRLVVQAQDNQLCIDGVEHGNRYRLTLRSGLPAASGETLHRDVELTLYVRDRSPGVRFPGRSNVLPRSAGAALPVETVNLSKLDLRLRRVSDRNLLRAVQDGYFGRPLSQYQEDSFAGTIAEEVWTGTAEVADELNREMTTRLPMGEAIAGQPPGIYALSASVPGADPYQTPGATQWFVLSDLGLSTMMGDDGLTVSVRGLSDATARAGIGVTLLSRANAVLARATTDADGFAVFAPGLTRGTGGAAPAMILAQQADADLAFLSLTEPAFDLSDRGVEGRAPAGPVDVFLTTDRGAYRAGETVFATALARDAGAQAIEGLPLTAVLRRPDGVEYLRRVSDAGQEGGHVFRLPVQASAPRGTWRLEIFGDPQASPLASQSLLVEDFLPEQIDFDLSLLNGPLRVGDTPLLQIEARYLFGAPGADLTIDGQVDLRAATASDDWPGFRFGRYDAQPDPRSSFFGGAQTDAQGRATVPIEIPELEAAGQPLQATVTVRLADGGARPVERRLTVPVQPHGPVIGIRPGFDDVVPEGAEARFAIIGLDADLVPQPMQVRWTLNRVETRYQWYQLYGNWNWEPVTRRTRIATGEAALGTDPTGLDLPVEWGRYELVVERTGGAYAAASVDFEAGWYAAGDSAATPDRLEVALDKASYVPGDTARLRIVPRMAGTALISVLSNRVIERRIVEVPAGETVIPLTVTEDWGTGAYVTAAVLRPMDVEAGQNPARAIGLAYATVEPVGKQLNVEIIAPEATEPRQAQDVRVRVTGTPAGETVWFTLAAVDLGILNLTGFQSPDPQAYYFGQRRLGVELRDVYGRLIDGMSGALGTVRSGGDVAGLRMQSPPPTQELMAQFSGPVEIGPDGTATVRIDLPAFNGTVRLMAVAWSRSAVGQAQLDMLVRDPVVVTASLPRFLAPGDRSRMRLEVVHADGPTGNMQLSVRADPGIVAVEGDNIALTLGDGDKAIFNLPLVAKDVGDAAIEVSLTTPDGRRLTQSLTLPVRANDPAVAQTRRFALGAGESFVFGPDVFAGLRSGTGSALLSAGPLARFDVPGLLSALDRYPYGCTEQVTSQALPLLYLSSVAQASGLGDATDVRDRVDDAIARVLSRQTAGGSFGLWQAGSGEFWLDAYVADFLSRAQAAGYEVPDLAFRAAMDNLRNRLNYAPDFDSGGEDIAYALMVLAREGAAAMGDLRYYADVKGAAFATPLAMAQVGAALAFYGDQMRADAMFARAALKLAARAPQEMPVWRTDFGTDLRDAAGVLALAVAAGSSAVDTAQLSAEVAAATGAPMSTQEAAWALLAAEALVATPESSGLLVDGAPVAGPFVRAIQQGTATEAFTVSAADGRATEITLTTIGVPDVPPAAGGAGYAIERRYFGIDGTPLTGAPLTVGARFVTVLTVTPFDAAEARLIVDDPLPAGVEIDNPNLLRSGDIRALGWLSPSEAVHAEFRSDRFIAAVDLRGGDRVTLAYVARAVTPGDYHHPAASVEDMYRPRLRARTATGQVTVTE